MLALWWVWAIGGAVLLAITALLPEAILLGMAVSAFVVGLLLLVGGPVAVVMGGSVPLTLLVFGIVSFVIWVIVRRVIGVRPGQVRVWTTDINDD